MWLLYAASPWSRFWGQQTHISLSCLFICSLSVPVYHFSSVFSLCTSTSCSDYTFPTLLCHSSCSYFLFSTTLFTIPSSRPFCQREAIAAITRNMPEWRDTLLQTERDSALSLSKWPVVFLYTAASGVWESAAAVWGSRQLWGVLHPDVYAACHHK